MRSTPRTLCLAVLVVLAPAVVVAQSASNFKTGSKIASVGVLTGGDNYDGAGVGGTVEFGALSVTKSIHLGIGASLGYMRSSEGSGSFKISVSQIPVYAIGNLHFSPPSQPKLDLYAGASVGLTYYRASGDGFVEDQLVSLPPESVFLLTRRSGATRLASTSNTETGFGIQGGAHFGLTDAISLTAQVGLIDIPLFYGGVSFKF